MLQQMLPPGMPAAIPSAPNPHAMPANASSSPPGRSRLRGLSYIRQVTHSVHHHHSHSPAAPTIVTASTASAATQHSHGTAASAASPGGRRSAPIEQTSRGTSNASTKAVPPISSTGNHALTRAATHPSSAESSNVPISSGHSSPSAAQTNGGNQSSVNVIRPRSDSLPHITQVRSIDEALSPQPSDANVATPRPAAGPAGSPSRLNDQPNAPAASIRFTPHIDIRASREALTFTPIERILKTGDEVIRVGRYSEKDNQPSARDPSGANTAPVGFKSKVVSRRHCEFWYDNGQWFVKDVKSSSGTFLNHIRLSAPGAESRAFPLYDGDVLQLGIDFKGGEEPIFRCVKIRVELNRAWQKGLNNFNMSAHKRIRNMAASSRPQGDTASVHTSECSICLMAVAPCQALFVAPCSHVWHYKCIRPLVDKGFPMFLCPNCRAHADLGRDIEEDESLEYQNSNVADSDESRQAEAGERPRAITDLVYGHEDEDGEDAAESAVGDAVTEIGGRGIGDDSAAGDVDGVEAGPSTPQRNSGRRAQQSLHTDNESIRSRSSADRSSHEDPNSSDDSGRGGGNGNNSRSGGPMTPRNDIGPFVFDGAARGRGRGSEEALVIGALSMSEQ